MTKPVTGTLRNTAIDAPYLRPWVNAITVHHILDIPGDCTCTWIATFRQWRRKWVNRACPHHYSI